MTTSPPGYVPVMPFVFIILFLLPIRLHTAQLKSLAFFLWLTGGCILAFFGVTRLQMGTTSLVTMGIIGGVALAIGFAKGKFVLSKTSQRNIERLDSLTGPMRPIHVYSRRSWITVAVMVGISIVLNTIEIPLLWRAGINLTIGFALITSSLAYLKSAKNAPLV